MSAFELYYNFRFDATRCAIADAWPSDVPVVVCVLTLVRPEQVCELWTIALGGRSFLCYRPSEKDFDKGMQKTRDMLS